MDKSSEKACKKRLRKALKKAYRAWDREREAAEPYGQSHINDIDAIFSREIKRLEELYPGVYPRVGSC